MHDPRANNRSYKASKDHRDSSNNFRPHAWPVERTTKSLKRKPRRKEEARKKGENLRHTRTHPHLALLSVPPSPNFVFSIFSLSFLPPIFLPLLRFSPEWRVLRHRRVCIASLFQARVPRLLFPRSSPPSPVLPPLPTPFHTHHFRRGRLVVSTRETPLSPPSLFFLFLSLLSPPFLFRFASSPSVLPLPSLSLGARTDGRGATSRFTSLGDMSFSTLVARVSPSHPTAPLVESQDGTRGLVFADEGRDVADGQSIFSFLFFFENLFYW